MCDTVHQKPGADRCRIPGTVHREAPSRISNCQGAVVTYITCIDGLLLRLQLLKTMSLSDGSHADVTPCLRAGTQPFSTSGCWPHPGVMLSRRPGKDFAASYLCQMQSFGVDYCIHTAIHMFMLISRSDTSFNDTFRRHPTWRRTSRMVMWPCQS